MTRIRSFARIAAVALLAMAIALPMFAARGSANFSKFVAIGDSYGAGYEAGSLNERHQPYSWPAIVAKQAGLSLCPATAVATDNCFAQPLIAYPGLPGGELVFTGTTIVNVPGSGAPLMSGFGRPFNNLSVPGYTVGAVLTIKGTEANAGLGLPILRGLGTEVDQALAQQPTFIAVWIGGNDFLGAVSQGNPDLLTPTATFTAAYNAILDKLVAGAPNAAIVAAAASHNVPVADVKGLFDRFVTGINTGGVTLTNTYVSGGLFSNDGVHLTDIGYMLMANEFIKAINNGYGSHIPLASVT